MRWPSPPPLSVLWTQEFRIDVRPLGRLVREHPECVLLCLGTALRISTYLINRSMWMDEGMIKGNIVGIPVFEFHRPLTAHQMAPFGFLIFERAMSAVFGERNYVLRFLPLAAGILGLYLSYRVVPRFLPRRAAIVALALFALSDDLIYYSSELKPYSIDAAASMAVLLVSCHVLGRSPSARVLVWMGILAAALPWFSLPSAFSVAGCGAVLFFDAVMAGRVRTAIALVLIGVGWAASFLVSFDALRTMLSADTPMYRFWDFAFLPLTLPPTREGLLKSAGLLVEVFVNPLNLLSPGETQIGCVVPLALLVIGLASLALRAPRLLLLIAAPIGLAIGASIGHYYPFHGRLILGLVTPLYMVIAEGTEWIAGRFASRTRIFYHTVLVALLFFPSMDAMSNGVTRRIRDFNMHGDLHHNVFIDQDIRYHIREQRATTAVNETDGRGH